jgi:hypothetical protein
MCFRSRESGGEKWTVYNELADDEITFYQYFRMSKHQFNYLLQKIEKDLKKNNTTFREAISSVEKLTTCLRYVNFSLMLYYLKTFIEVTKNTVSRTVNNRKSTAYLIEK